MLDNESGARVTHPKGPIIVSAQPDFTFYDKRQSEPPDELTSYLAVSKHGQEEVSLVCKHRVTLVFLNVRHFICKSNASLC